MKSNITWLVPQNDICDKFRVDPCNGLSEEIENVSTLRCQDGHLGFRMQLKTNQYSVS